MNIGKTGEKGEKLVDLTANNSPSKVQSELATDKPLQVDCKLEELSTTSTSEKDLSIDKLKELISKNEEVKNWIIHGYPSGNEPVPSLKSHQFPHYAIH